MKKLVAAAAVVSLFAVPVGAQEKVAKLAKPVKTDAVLLQPADLKWTDVPNAPGVQTAVVEGDAAKGEHHFFLKFPAGFSVGAHHHSSDHYGTLVTGTLVLTVDGQEKRLPPGSFVGFTHKKAHATRCEAGGECVMFIHSKAKWDAVMVETQAARK